MEIVTMPLQDIKVTGYPIEISDEDKQAIEKNFADATPVIVTKDRYLVNGFNMYHAAAKIGMATMRVLQLD